MTKLDLKSMTLAVTDGIARLTFTQAGRGNPIDATFCADLAEVAIRVSEDPAARCLLITAEGKAFSYGGDIGALVADLDELPLNIKRWTMTLHSAIARLQRMDAPIVVAVHGACAGGMAAFVAGADLVVAGPAAKFVAAYPAIGFSCDAGASAAYARRMGVARGRRFLIMNETLDAASALAAGLVDEVVDADALAGRAETVATTLARGPTAAYGVIRRLFLSALDQPLEAQLELEAQGLARLAGSSDAREGLIAFAEKRRPAFSGR